MTTPQLVPLIVLQPTVAEKPADVDAAIDGEKTATDPRSDAAGQCCGGGSCSI
ncbi:hypothetical protein [Microbacterium rhizomatis]|uniref:hypothetical protein n=1 Tax=Microbacterium rhizomatis TaxID=1631477 RepID=UPI0014798370|nr:hypothetical protein [Microbacterium rhizomatis]